MLYSKSSVYALRASVYLARKNCSSYVTIKELSDELNISFHFLTKVLQQLTRSNILKSYQGPNGGVKLHKPACKITFIDIVESIDGNNLINECALGLPECGELQPCPLHDHWHTLREDLETMMNTLTIADLADRKIDRTNQLLKQQNEKNSDSK